MAIFNDRSSSLPAVENANALSFTPKTTSSTASDNIVSQDTDTVKNNIRNNSKSDTHKLTDKYTLTPTKNTKTGADIWVISLNSRISKEEYTELSSIVKKLGGYYSRLGKTPDGKPLPGFVFKAEPAENVIGTFNNFFGDTKEIVQVAPEKHKNVLNNHAESYIIKEKEDKDGVNDVHNGILAGESGNDNAVRESEPVSEIEEKRHIGTDDRELDEDVAPEDGTHIQSPEATTSAAGQHDSRDNNNRVRESDNSNGNSGTGFDGNDNVDVIESNGKSKDFVITKTVAEDIDKSAPSMADNIKAIETLHAIEKSSKTPTKTQQGLLAKFKGWGGLAGSFYGANKTKLQELMSESELKAAQGTVNDAYFTPTN